MNVPNEFSNEATMPDRSPNSWPIMPTSVRHWDLRKGFVYKSALE